MCEIPALGVCSDVLGLNHDKNDVANENVVLHYTHTPLTHLLYVRTSWH